MTSPTNYFTLALVLAVAMAMTAHAQDCRTQPPEPECRAMLPAWYYDTNVNRCTLRQCHSQRNSGNRFDTELECQQQCEGGRGDGAAGDRNKNRLEPGVDEDREDREHQDDADDDVCQLQSLIGPCRARMRRYYFDASRGRCRPFYYGGCQSNGNNFTLKRDCRKRCKGRRGRGRRPKGDHDHDNDDDGGHITDHRNMRRE